MRLKKATFFCPSCLAREPYGKCHHIKIGGVGWVECPGCRTRMIPEGGVNVSDEVDQELAELIEEVSGFIKVDTSYFDVIDLAAQLIQNVATFKKAETKKKRSLAMTEIATTIASLDLSLGIFKTRNKLLMPDLGEIRSCMERDLREKLISQKKMRRKRGK